MTALLANQFEQQTAAYRDPVNPVDADTPRSVLLEEMLSAKPFAMHSMSTSLSNSSAIGELPFPTDNLNFGWFTPTLAEISPRRSVIFRRQGEESGEEVSERSASDRVVLLARKYVAKESFSDEQRARLAILNERVRQLVPAVTSDESGMLEAALQTLMQLSQSDKDIRNVLGLDR